MKVYDSDIRSLLLESFLEVDDYVNEEDTVIINELDICSGVSRVDLAVVNGRMHGYEIKSKQDNLERLPLQIESYDKVFDTMTIVAHEEHIKKVKDIVPKWWEVKCVVERKDGIKIKNVRKGKQNRNISLYNVAMLLWKDEMIELLLTYADIKKGYKSKTRSELSTMIIHKIDSDIITGYVRSTLKSRINWKAVPIQMLNDD